MVSEADSEVEAVVIVVEEVAEVVVVEVPEVVLVWDLP